MTERDYSKFVREGETGPRLHVKLIPRTVYIEMVNRWKRRPDVIDDVAEEGFWLWDLNERSAAAAAAGRDASRAELAEEIAAEMDDREWWKSIEAFEERLIQHFPQAPTEWSDLLDPVYDQQEREGWIPRQ